MDRQAGTAWAPSLLPWDASAHGRAQEWGSMWLFLPTTPCADQEPGVWGAPLGMREEEVRVGRRRGEDAQGEEVAAADLRAQ